MLFYRIDGDLLNWPEGDDRAVAAALQMKTEAYYRERKNKSFMFLARGTAKCITAGLITKESVAPAELAEAYLLRAELNCENISISEITMKEMTMLLRSADRRDYISDDDEVLSAMEIKGICRQYGLRFTENMICGDERSKKSLISESVKLMWDQTLIPEIERIFAGSKVSAIGHPVHYIVSSDDNEQRETTSEILLRALHDNGRVTSGRVCVLRSFDDIDAVSDLYKNCAGGTVIISCRDEDGHGGAYNSRSVGEMTELCAVARKYRNIVLTVFWLPVSDNRMKSVIMESMGSTPMVELRENAITLSAARAYLRRCAKEHGVSVNKKLYSIADGADTVPTKSTLDQGFSEWLSSWLRTSVYPQYASIRAACAQAKESQEKHDSTVELDGMIGLKEAKRVINRALSYYKAQRMFAEKGIASGCPAMHMVFTGNPGTAKTTVARLFARIMKEHGLLSGGELVEVGRADLVGKYVGWTAKIVKSCFQRARGGVLFIDEAYSLVDDKEGMYGDEAINTIVQEMENNRDDVIVIFAGYPDKMAEFLQRNPGLRSRIAFHVPFSDYTPEELCGISAHIAQKKGLSLSAGARERLMKVFETAVLTNDFGNGRFARNIIEQAQMEQAVRLVNMDYDRVTRKDVSTLLAEDIVVTQHAEEQRMCIGF